MNKPLVITFLYMQVREECTLNKTKERYYFFLIKISKKNIAMQSFMLGEIVIAIEYEELRRSRLDEKKLIVRW